jgi:ribosomal-protein-alanine N-acetyltransferase
VAAIGPEGPPEPGSTIVRPFAPSDLRDLLKLESKAFGKDAYDASDFESFRLMGTSFLVAVVSGSLAGYSVGWVTSHGGELISLAVAPAMRRLGVGSRLALAVLDDLRRQGARSCRLQVRISNLGAIDFYTKLGFKVVRMWREYYRDYESAYVMRMRLGSRRRDRRLSGA